MSIIAFIFDLTTLLTQVTFLFLYMGNVLRFMSALYIDYYYSSVKYRLNTQWN